MESSLGRHTSCFGSENKVLLSLYESRRSVLTCGPDSNMARDAFATFIPISVESDARTKIIFDFFDLMAAIAAHGKTNGLGGRMLSRLAGWWAFEHADSSSGFDGGYRSWARSVSCLSFGAEVPFADALLSALLMLQVTSSLPIYVRCRQNLSGVSMGFPPYHYPYKLWRSPPNIHRTYGRTCRSQRPR